MNLKDRTMEILLTLKDRCLNVLTLGWWGKSQSEKRVSVYREKGD